MSTLLDINKDYMTLPEVANFWKVPLEDIRYLGEEGELEICIRRIPVKVAIENILQKIPYMKDQPKKSREIIRLLDDPQPLHPTDIYLLFSNRGQKIKITRFKTMPIMKIIKIKSPEIEVSFDDMIITASERKRFEYERSNKLIKESISDPLVLKSGDFTLFELYGEKFSFGEKQAKVIKYLYDKYIAGDPWVHGKILLSYAESASDKMANLFSKSPSWKKVIIPMKHTGKYRINLPYTEPLPIDNPKDEDLPLFSYTKS